MRRNQKHSKEEMYLAIEKWQESGLSQHKFCHREHHSSSTFSYWLKKYKREKGNGQPVKTFIPVEVTGRSKTPDSVCGQIEITYPNGIQVSCPAGIDMHLLKALINI